MLKQTKRLTRVTKVTLLALVLQLFAGAPGFAGDFNAQKINEVRITNNQSYQYMPAIYENYIVYTDYRNNNYDIYLYDLTTRKETRITDNPKNQMYPAIWGDKIVYSDNRNDAKSDIYMYDLKTKQETPIAVGLGFQDSAKIYENKIVWRDFDYDRDSDIYMYDLDKKEKIRITADSSYEQHPAIYGDRIVWENQVYNGTDLCIYDISVGEKTILPAPGLQQAPDIYENKIVWIDNRNDNFDIYMYDMSTQKETQITSSQRSQESPHIYGEYIVWMDTSHDTMAADENVFVYNLKSQQEVQITHDVSPEASGSPVIYGNKIVWEGVRNNNLDIYMANLSGKLEKINIELKIGNPKMTINGENTEIDPGRGTKPLVVNGTTLIPLRAFIETLGGTVEWNTFEQKVTIDIFGKNIELWIGNNTAKVNGEPQLLAVPPQGINGRTMLPLRFVAETLGLDVKWNEKTESILISAEG